MVIVSSQTTLHLVFRNALGGGSTAAPEASTVVIFVSSNADLRARLSFVQSYSSGRVRAA